MSNPTQIRLTIDGRSLTAAPGQTILQVARAHGIEIPTLCYDPRLNPYGSCLLCVVEVEGQPRLALSCATEIREGMKIVTSSERIYKARKNALDMLLSNHFADCRGNCYEKCPAEVDVQGYLALASAGKYLDALELIRKTNPLPMVCGRVCVRYCEANCRRRDVDASVGVNFIKRYVADLASDHLPKPLPARPTGKRVAVVGGGPAGLTAAYYLARGGHAVTIFEAQSHLGGMLRWGIPDYRLPRDILDKEIGMILSLGVEARTRQVLGRDFTLDDLKAQKYDAIYLALGAWVAKKMRVKNEETPGVWGGIDFLRKVKQDGPPELHGHVLVVGGGNTAIDAARTALRCKAGKVSILYRRTREEMPADDIEIEDALAEGVEIKFLVAPVEVVAENGQVKALRCQEMTLGEPDESGRRRPVVKEGSDFEIPCSTIIAAIGQDSDLSGLKNERLGQIPTTKWGTIIVDEATYATSVPGVFAGGDVVTGPMAAIDAIGAGRKAAQVIDRYLETGQIKPYPREFLSKKTNLGEIPASYFAAVEKVERAHMRQSPVAERVQTFAEVDHGIPPTHVSVETSRCLSCGCSDVFTCEVKKLAGEYGVDQKRFAGKVKKYEVDLRHPFITLDPNKCILCGKCVRLCGELIGAAALGFVHRGFETIVRPSLDRPLQKTTCISCGNCIDVCPTAAIAQRLPFQKPGPWVAQPHESVCNHCGVGCGLVYHKVNDTIWYISARPAAAHVPGQICFKGRFAHEFLRSPERLREPTVGVGASRQTVHLDAALDAAVAGLQKVAATHGADSLAFIVSARATNEEIFLAQKLARQAFGCNNVSSLPALVGLGVGQPLQAATGAIASSATLADLARTELMILVNVDPDQDNPVLAFTIRQAHRRGAKLVVIGSAPTLLAETCDLWLDPRKGSSPVLLRAILAELVRQNAFLEQAVAEAANWAALRAEATLTLAEAAAATGVDEKKIAFLANLLAVAHRSVVFVAPGDSGEAHANADLQAISNLLVLGHRYGKEGSGLLLTRSAPNGQGLLDLFASPESAQNRLVGMQNPYLAGAMSLKDLRASLQAGRIKGLFVLNEDITCIPVGESLMRQTEWVVAMDLLPTGTTARAHVVLPGSAFAETDGTVTSMDRTVQAFAQVLAPPAGRTGWEILVGLWQRVLQRQPPTLQEIRQEIGRMNPHYHPIVRVGRSGSFRWNETEDGGDVLFAKGFLTEDRRPRFLTPALEIVADPERQALVADLTRSSCLTAAVAAQRQRLQAEAG
ncbi:MAG: Formate dehydrogenase, alpha subunit [Candidatus Ozemobacter sibiricus]|uniref:Formate dehydrogenase, alpha subunit n=1 Tax=Candidatus Ozemobacter sibiricus TaxID=2268124 RepID=A0A367ZSY7_9BACT|nr:MAG: Formate dehydrogenase, alpha subunit [Candidatus Ozemobacter sibiricus]